MRHSGAILPWSCFTRLIGGIMSESTLVISTQIGSFRLIEKPIIAPHRVHRYTMLKFCFKPVTDVRGSVDLQMKTKFAIEQEIGKNGDFLDCWLLNQGHIDRHGSGELRVKVNLVGVTDDAYDEYLTEVLEKLTEQLETRFGIAVDDDHTSTARRREHPQGYVNRTAQVSLR